MTERIDVDLRVLGLDPETVEDEDLRAAAAAASRVLNERGVVQDGVTSGLAALPRPTVRRTYERVDAYPPALSGRRVRA